MVREALNKPFRFQWLEVACTPRPRVRGGWRATLNMFADDPGMHEIFEEALRIREADRRRARRRSSRK